MTVPRSVRSCDATVTRERTKWGMLNGTAGNGAFSEPASEALKSNIEVYRGLGGFFLQSEMHALVTAVLLRMARLDPFNANPQAEPPDRELAQIE